MSGPIIRKYGFPNFEKIFGDREIQHGSTPPGEIPAPAGSTEPKLDVDAPDPDRAEVAGGPTKPADPRVPDSKP